MGDPARKLADGVHLLRLRHRLAHAFHLFLSQPSLRHIARDFRVADQSAIRRAYGIDDHVGPEFRAVLAVAPPFLFETAFARGRLQPDFRQAGCDVLGTVKFGEMPADDFLRRVALDAFGAGVPVRDDPLGGERVDRVVGDALDEKPELLPAFAEHVLGQFALRQIAGDLRVADQFAIGGQDRINDRTDPKPRAVFANAPTFSVEAALLSSRLQRELWQASLSVLIRIKTREMLADDFRRLIALETACAGIPTGHISLLIEHEDRVVSDRINEQTIAV